MGRKAIAVPIFMALVSLVPPAAAHAQSAIAGVVKDASGAVLSGVSVEASSDALIERTRSVVTNSQGQYTIVDLRPGVYSLSFSLAGFSLFKREGIELPANFTAATGAGQRDHFGNDRGRHVGVSDQDASGTCGMSSAAT